MVVFMYWLIVIDVKECKIVIVCEFDRIDDIWVCNIRDWLYCGISVEIEDEDICIWVLF